MSRPAPALSLTAACLMAGAAHAHPVDRSPADCVASDARCEAVRKAIEAEHVARRRDEALYRQARRLGCPPLDARHARDEPARTYAPALIRRCDRLYAPLFRRR